MKKLTLPQLMLLRALYIEPTYIHPDYKPAVALVSKKLAEFSKGKLRLTEAGKREREEHP